jgi:hypothetical protein
MGADEPAIDTEQLPIPTEGLLMTHFLAVHDVWWPAEQAAAGREAGRADGR